VLCVGIVAAEKPVKEPVDKIVLVHYKDNVKAIGFSATDQSTMYKLLGVKWKTPCVSYAINTANSRIDSDAAIKNIQNAVNTWDGNTTGLSFQYTGTTGNAASQDNQNTVSWGPINNNNVIAQTTIWFTRNSKEILETDIQMNSKLNWNTTGSANAYDVQDIATHEMGHVCGLGDLYNSPASELTMYGYSSIGETKKDTLGNGDILGLHKLYG
jgi:hypothetical protein